MMVNAASIRSQLDSKVFNKIGQEVTIKALLSVDTDAYGDQTRTYDSGTVVKAVPYDYLKIKREVQPFGDYEGCDVALIVRYDTSVNKDSLVVYDNKDFIVSSVEELNIGDGTNNYVLAKVLLLREEKP